MFKRRQCSALNLIILRTNEKEFLNRFTRDLEFNFEKTIDV